MKVFDVAVDLRSNSYGFGKLVDYYTPEYERTIAWNLEEAPIISTKDRLGKSLREAEVFR